MGMSKFSDGEVHFMNSGWKGLIDTPEIENTPAGFLFKGRPIQQKHICFPGPIYITFFMLNWAEHEIFSANKYENANYFWHFYIYYPRKFHAHLYLARKNLQ